MKLRREGLFQALAITLYISLIGIFFHNADDLFGNLSTPFAPILMLLLFSTSALICGALVFYKPYRLFVAGKTKDAAEVVVSTAVWLFVFLAVFFGALIIFK